MDRNNISYLERYRYISGWLLVSQLSLFFPIYYISEQGSFLRYLIYIIPLNMVLFSIIYKLPVEARAFKFLTAYLAVCFLSLYKSPLGFSAFSEFYFLLGSILCFISGPIVVSKHLKVLFISCVMTMALVFVKEGGKGFSVDLTQSEGGAEGSYGLMLGAILVYFWVVGDKMWAMATLIATLFAFKRISIGGAFISCIIFSFVMFFPRYKAVLSQFFIGIVFLFCIMISVFFTEILDYFYSADLIGDPVLASSGRYTIMKYVKYEVIDDFSSIFLGNGIGASGVWVKSLGYSGFPFIGNEWVKFIFDFGVVGFFLFMWGMFSFYLKTSAHYPILIYVLIVSLTEATFVFIFDSITFMLVARGIYERQRFH